MLVIHPHFHARRTGITRHVESVIEAMGSQVEARALGSSLRPDLPRLGWGELWGRIRRERVVWHAHRNHELLVGLLLKLLGREVRLVYTRHSVERPGLLSSALARAADGVIALTSQVASALGLPSTVLGHGVELNRFRPPADREASWNRLGLGGRFGVGVVGRIRPRKGQGDFAAAVGPLLESHLEWRAVVAGRAKARERAFLKELRSSVPGLLVAGEQEDIVPWYQGLTVLVQPSRSESFSLVLLEAMACGCCVVAAQLPHYPERIEHGRTGFLYPVGEVGALREQLAELMEDPARARRIGQNAAEEARRRFGVEDEVKGLLELYRSLLPGPGKEGD